MSGSAYLTVVTVGSAAVALWLLMRLPKLAPKTGRGATFCFMAAWAVLNLAVPLLALTRAQLPLGIAVFISTFPVFTASFAFAGACFRYLIDLMGHAIR